MSLHDCEFKLEDLPVVFISYNEPQANDNFAWLQERHFNVQRVDGIKGSDASHKAAARLIDEEYFITVDADCRVVPWFADVPSQTKLEPRINISFPSVNLVNGLCYGNGSTKIWHTPSMLNTPTHESLLYDATNDKHKFEFCWAFNYVAEKRPAGIVDFFNEQQAWRAGYREGAKLLMHEGKFNGVDFLKQNCWGNFCRLITWYTVGWDHKYGLNAISGAITGSLMVLSGNYEADDIRDFDVIDKKFTKDHCLALHEETDKLSKLLDHPIHILTPNMSKQHKIINSHNYHAGRYFSKFF
jgi:hypothetical protein